MVRAQWKRVGALSLLVASTHAGAATTCPVVVDSIWQLAITTAVTTLVNEVIGRVTGTSNSNATNERKIMSALKVQTKQISVSADKEAANTSQVMQALSTTVIAQETAFQVQKVMEDFGASTGQGFDPCGEQVKSRAVAAGYADSTNVVNMVRGVDAAPGVYKNRGTTLAVRVSEHKANFCTTDEKNAGLCTTVGANAGASLTFSTMLQTARVGDIEDRAKNAFVNHIFGLPDQPLDANRANTPEGLAYVRDKMMRDGFRSISMTSLKAVQAMGTSAAAGGASTADNDGHVADQSFLEAVKTKVDQYAGGAKYKQWEVSLTTQSERGLLVNLAKMSAFKLYMTAVEYDQYERMEANLAGLLAIENRNRGGVR